MPEVSELSPSMSSSEARAGTAVEQTVRIKAIAIDFNAFTPCLPKSDAGQALQNPDSRSPMVREVRQTGIPRLMPFLSTFTFKMLPPNPTIRPFDGYCS